MTIESSPNNNNNSSSNHNHTHPRHHYGRLSSLIGGWSRTHIGLPLLILIFVIVPGAFSKFSVLAPNAAVPSRAIPSPVGSGSDHNNNNQNNNNNDGHTENGDFSLTTTDKPDSIYGPEVALIDKPLPTLTAATLTHNHLNGIDNGSVPPNLSDQPELNYWIALQAHHFNGSHNNNTQDRRSLSGHPPSPSVAAATLSSSSPITNTITNFAKRRQSEETADDTNSKSNDSNEDVAVDSSGGDDTPAWSSSRMSRRSTTPPPESTSNDSEAEASAGDTPWSRETDPDWDKVLPECTLGISNIYLAWWINNDGSLRFKDNADQDGKLVSDCAQGACRADT